jgi:hypothetical protein
VSPSWLVVDFLVELNIESIIHVDVVWGSFSIVEVSEWTIIVGITGVVTPSWFILDLLIELDIEAVIHVHVVWAGFSVVEMGEWTIVVGVARVVAPSGLVQQWSIHPFLLRKSQPIQREHG